MCDRDRVFELISDELDGILDKDGRAELASCLEADPEAREIRELLTSAHKLLDFEADPPAELLSNVMRGVEEQNRARRASRARVIRLTAGFAAAAVLAVAILPGALRRDGAGQEENDSYGVSFMSEPSGDVEPDPQSDDSRDPAFCYNPHATGEDSAVFMLPGAPRDEHFTAQEFCADYYAVLYFSKLPAELTDPEPVTFSDGTAGHIITLEQYEQYRDLADTVEYPNPDGVLIMAVAPAEE